MVKCEVCGKEFPDKGIGTHMWRMHGSGKNFRPTLGKPAWNKGLTKETSEAVKRQAASLRRPKSELELKLDDDGKLIQRWRDKCVNALQEGLKCELTFEEYCVLVDKAGLVSSQLGFTGEKYVLARYNDRGNYTFDNCRFITQSENSQEKINHMTFTEIECVDDNLVFKSAVDASKYYNIHVDTLFNHIKSGKPVKGLNKTFRRL